MYEAKLVGVYILFVTSVCVRCITYFGPLGPDKFIGNCDIENQNTLAEIKSEIQNLQQLVVGLRQKLDANFELPNPQKSIALVVYKKRRNTAKPIPTEIVEDVVKVSETSKSSADSKCPPGFQYVDQARNCYKVVNEELSWTAARRRCHDLHPGAHLAAITNIDKNIGLIAYLRPEIPKNSRRGGFRLPPLVQYTLLWTSGQRLNETSCTDEFVWKMANSTQLPLSFTFWDRDEPNCNLNQAEGCLQLRSFHGFTWNDAPCDTEAFPLCEYDPL